MKPLICLALFALPLLAQTTPTAKELSLKECVALVDATPGLLVVDIRTPNEYADGHIAGATNINFFAKDFDQQISELKKDQPLLLHCAAGGRSAKARDRMQKAGFTKLFHLTRGYQNRDWEALDQKVAK